MPKKNDSFESLMKKLEDIVNKMENEALSLEDSMRNYEEGIKLSNKLYKYLQDAEGRVKILVNGKEEDFNINEE